jgi:hypothetical protein
MGCVCHANAGNLPAYFFHSSSQKNDMAHKTTNSSRAIKKLRQFLNLAHISKILQKKNFFNLVNKEEDEDNEQTGWPFTGRPVFSRLSLR